MKFLYHIDQIEEAGKKVIDFINSEKVVTFSGDLGAGKTTLIANIGKQLGSGDNISSPTFSLIQQYDFPKGTIYHLDMYRINDVQEAIDAGIEEILAGNDLCFIEWAERIQPLLPLNYAKVRIDLVNAAERILHIELHK